MLSQACLDRQNPVPLLTFSSSGVSGEAAQHLSLFLTTPGSSVSANQVLHKIAIVDQVCDASLT